YLKLLAFRIRSRSRTATDHRLIAFSPAIPRRQRSTCLQAPTGASIPAYGKPNPENGALSSRRASSAISLRVSLSSQATTARSALSELATLSCHRLALPERGKLSKPQKSSTPTTSESCSRVGRPRVPVYYRSDDFSRPSAERWLHRVWGQRLTPRRC